MNDSANMIDQTLRHLAGQELDRSAVLEIIELHGRVAKGLGLRTGDRWLSSFVSKYLHFHCDVIPVFDDRARSTIGQFIDLPTVYRLRTTLAEPKVRAKVYYRFATAFLALRERIAAETAIPVTVKEIDYLPWQATRT